MATSASSSYILDDGFEIYQRTWTPNATPEADIIFLHGFSDRIDHYDTFFKILLSTYPIRIFGWDRRGWGKSVHNKSERGDTGDKQKQIVELNSFINHIAGKYSGKSGKPLFLMGHSMGGQETAYYMLNSQSISDDARPKISGFILEAPFIGIDAATQPTQLKVVAGRIACKLLPRFQIPNPIKLEYISPDPAVQKMYGDDPLCHSLGTLECFRDMLDRSAELVSLSETPSSPPVTLKNKLPCPVLWTHGTVDRACDFPSSKKLFESLESCSGWDERESEGDKVWKEYDGWLHQLHNQPSPAKEEYAKDVGDWIMLITGRQSKS